MAEKALITLLVGVFVVIGAQLLGDAISKQFHRTADTIECATQRATVCIQDDAKEGQ